jgi:Flp pilus assembly protein TadD
MGRKNKNAKRVSDTPSSAGKGRRNKRATAYDHLQLGVIFYRSKSYDLAIEQFQLARKQAPHSPNVWNNLGVAYLDKGELGEAMSAFEQALKLKPDYASAYFNLGQLYDVLGDHQKARECLRRVIEYDKHGELGRRAKERIEGFHPKVVFSLH